MPLCPSFPFIRASLFHLYPFYIKHFPAHQNSQDISNMSSNAYPFLALLNTQIWENCIFGWGMGQALSNMSFIADPFMAFLPPKYAKTAHFGWGKGPSYHQNMQKQHILVGGRARLFLICHPLIILSWPFLPPKYAKTAYFGGGKGQKGPHTMK